MWSGGLLLALGVVHAVLLIADPGVQFFFGDSSSYLTAAEHYVPLDRSWLYGKLIGVVTGAGRDLTSLVAAQVSAWLLTSWGFGLILRRAFDVRWPIVFVVTLLASVFPLHVLWTRYVMTETFAMAVFTAMLWLMVEYLRARSPFRVAWLVPLQALGILAIALRTAMLPVALFTAVVVPCTGLFSPGTPASRSRFGRTALLLLELAIALGCMVPLHRAYQRDYAERIRYENRLGARPEPAYTYASGAFYVEFWSPLIEAGDFPPGFDGQGALDAAVGRNDPRERNEQHWAPTGLVQQIRDRVAASSGAGRTGVEIELEVDRIAKATALHAARRDPLGVLGLCWQTFVDHWDPTYLCRHMQAEIGLDRITSERTRQLLEARFGFAVGDRTLWVTPLKAAFLSMGPYVTAMSLAGLAVLLLWRAQRRHRAFLAVLAMLLLYFWAALHVLSTLPCGRFQQPVSWLLWLLVVGRFAGRPGSAEV